MGGAFLDEFAKRQAYWTLPRPDAEKISFIGSAPYVGSFVLQPV